MGSTPIISTPVFIPYMYQRTSYRPSRPQPPKFKINDFITAPTVRVLDDQGENLGVMPLIQARQIAKERGVDMVQIAQTPTEAVVKLIELGKFKYQQGKKEQKEKSHEKKTGSKIIRVGYLSQQHDLETKAKQADKFMAVYKKVFGSSKVIPMFDMATQGRTPDPIFALTRWNPPKSSPGYCR